MPPQLALIICVIFVLFLLRIEHKQNNPSSAALWVPTLWMLYCGSRSVGDWFQYRAADIEQGNPYDRIVLSSLILVAIYIVNKRKIDWPPIIKNNAILILLFILSGISILWSDYPFLSIKRWIRLAGIVPVSMVILGERNPAQALETILRRCAYVLIPFSFILIRYYPQFGRLYHPWSGKEIWIGVTLTKNTLGQLCAYSAIFIVWAFIKKWRNKELPKSSSINIADALILTMATYLLFGLGAASGSITSIVSLIIIIASMLFFYFFKKGAQFIATFSFFGIAFTWILFIFGKSIVANITRILGRDSTFTGRADFWPMLLKEGAQHPIFGAGFGGYFNTPGNEFSALYGFHVAHNGLLSVYVELGIIGVILVLALYISFFNKFRSEINHFFDWGVFGICLVIISWLVGFSETLFLDSSSYLWSIMVFMAVLFSRPHMLDKQNDHKLKNPSPIIEHIS